MRKSSSDDHKPISYEDFILMNDLDLDEETSQTYTEDNKRKSAEDINQSRMKKVRMDAAGDNSNPEDSSSPVSERYPYLDLPPSLPPYLLNDEPFTPHSDLQLQLVQHGYPSLAAAKALYWTGNTCLETAVTWLKSRGPSTWSTPLSQEIAMMKADLEARSSDVRDRLSSSDSGYASTKDEAEEVEEAESLRSYYKLVIVVNGCLRMRTNYLLRLIGNATLSMITKLSSHYFGDDQLSQWQESGQDIQVVRGEGFRHLEDLQLAASSLGLVTHVEGGGWDRDRMRYRDLLVLALWGDTRTVHQAAGRLPEYPTIRGLMA